MDPAPFKLPPLFPISVVRAAFGGLRHPASVERILTKLNAYEGRGLVKPTVLQDNYPTIYRECCRIILERHMGCDE